MWGNYGFGCFQPFAAFGFGWRRIILWFDTEKVHSDLKTRI